MADDKQIEVTENDELLIPVQQINEVTPGVYRINPDSKGYAKLRAWAKRQGTIKIA
jgi:hypothetical protein